VAFCARGMLANNLAGMRTRVGSLLFSASQHGQQATEQDQSHPNERANIRGL